MSLPVTAEEKAQFTRTQQLASTTENVVSTACPGCGTRFAVLARLDASGWTLHCTRCHLYGKGELKT